MDRSPRHDTSHVIVYIHVGAGPTPPSLSTYPGRRMQATAPRAALDHATPKCLETTRNTTSLRSKTTTFVFLDVTVCIPRIIEASRGSRCGLGAFYLLCPHVGKNGGGGIKSPIHFYCLLHAHTKMKMKRKGEGGGGAGRWHVKMRIDRCMHGGWGSGNATE